MSFCSFSKAAIDSFFFFWGGTSDSGSGRHCHSLGLTDQCQLSDMTNPKWHAALWMLAGHLGQWACKWSGWFVQCSPVREGWAFQDPPWHREGERYHDVWNLGCVVPLWLQGRELCCAPCQSWTHLRLRGQEFVVSAQFHLAFYAACNLATNARTASLPNDAAECLSTRFAGMKLERRRPLCQS